MFVYPEFYEKNLDKEGDRKGARFVAACLCRSEISREGIHSVGVRFIAQRSIGKKNGQ